MLLSVIIPMLNEEELCLRTYERLESVLKEIPHELLFIDDGSTDRTRELLLSAIPPGSRHRVISFSRNFGHQAAFTAGLDHAKGDAVVIIDGDLQDPPELILEMVEKWREGYQVVYAQRRKRDGESFFKLFTAKLYYRALQKLTSVQIPVDTGDYRLMDRQVVEALKRIPERSRFLRGLVPWVGFKQIGILYDREERSAGETKYSLNKMAKLAIDGITSFSVQPLRFSLWVGLTLAILGLLGLLWSLCTALLSNSPLNETALLVSLLLLIGGLLSTGLGIIGEYLGRIYTEVRQRPLYIIHDKQENDSDE